MVMVVGDTADAFPYSPKEWKDSDHDGIGDNTDAFPYILLQAKTARWSQNPIKTCNITGLAYNTTYT